MEKSWIKNKAVLATSDARKLVLDAIEAGFDAIDTEKIIKDTVKLDGKILQIKDQQFDLADIQHIYVIGFGKASCQAASALSDVLGPAIKQGIAIGLEPIACEFVATYGGTHPLPSPHNVSLSEKIVQLSRQVTEKDLVITIVSGGGSALLCWPIEECDQSIQLYNEFLKSGGDISELNTARKHLSGLKGGGLAKMLYPARVVGLIFSDVPGDHFDDVSSGPTYKDESTIADAQAIIDKYKLEGQYDLVETPKDNKYFEKVSNVPLVSNTHLLEAMQIYLKSQNVSVKIVSAEMYEGPEQVIEDLFGKVQAGEIVLGAGEPKIIIDKAGGSGGRCLLVSMGALSKLNDKDVFAAVASDGLDNSDAAGAIIDATTKDRIQKQNLDTADYQNRFDGYTYFAKLGNELLLTGPTQANISDFFILYRSL